MLVGDRPSFVDRLLLATAAFAFGNIATTAHSQSNFYEGKTVSLVVGFPPGGGYDVYARVIARYLPNHLPGVPTIVVQNMPGAGSLNLANHLYNVAPKDGTVIGSIEPSIPFEALFRGNGVRFDPLKFTWIGALNAEVTSCQVWHASPVQSFQDLLTKGATFGGTSSGTRPIVEPKVINEVLGAKIKVIPGYPGTRDIFAAMERGEVEGTCGVGWSSLRSAFSAQLKEGKIRLLVQNGLKKNLELGNTPLILEFARNDDERKILELLAAPGEIARPYLAPPDIPKERVEALRTAFTKTVEDRAFLADAEKAGIDINPVSGEQIMDVLTATFRTPPALVDKMISARE